jgi:hypothetical protein
MNRVSCPASLGFLLVALPAIAGAQLVSEGPDGLIYQSYANEGQSNVVNAVPDFSRAGYRGGGVAIPFVPAEITLTPSGGDDTTAIQNAINAVSALPVGPTGFRGAVLLTEGGYHVSSTLTITVGGIVIRGGGQQDGGGTRITYTATTKSNLFEISGGGGPATTGSAFAITDAFVPVGSRTFNVTNASGFVPGDLIQITHLMNQKWIDDIGMNSSGVMGAEAWTPGGYQLKHFRFIESITGNQLTLDAPMVQTVENLYGGGVVQKATWSGALDQVGIEGIRMESTFANATDENHGWYAITMQGVRNGWVRQVTSRYFGQGLVTITNRSMFVTVEDCAHLDPKSTTAGGNRYSFNIDDSSYILFQRCLARDGRHDFASGSQTPGPNAFVDGLATAAQNDIGPHHRYSTGQIYDNIKTEDNPNDSDDAIRVQNRTTSGSGHGWAGAQIMFWNSDAPEIVCDAPVGAMNWAIGNVGVQAESTRSPWEPFGIWQSHNSPVLPRSLYYAQLRDRLGANALREVTLPQQNVGTLWTELKDWDGDGLLLDPLIVWADAEAALQVGVPIALHARIRDLRVLDDSSTVSWTQVSGPGTASFADSAALETHATFDQLGNYVFQLAVSGGGSNHIATTAVMIGDGDTTPPAMPTGLSARYDPGAIRLKWDESAEPVTYRVYRRTASGYGAPLAGDLPGSGYVDTTIVPGETYYYMVTAVDVYSNESAPSDERIITAVGIVTTSFDFGTDPGKVTASADGFSLSSSGTGGFNDRADGLEAVSSATSGFENLTYLRPFPGLGGGQSRDFKLTTEIRVNELIGTAQENNDRWGIHMFGSAGNEVSSTDGISAQILAKGNTGGGAPVTAQIGLRLGLNGNFLVSADWVGGAVVPDDAFRLVVDATFLSETELSLGFTVSRLDGSGSQTVQSVVSGAVLTGDLFGGSLRIKNERAIEYDNFTVALVSRDTDGDHIDDDWERFYFGGIGIIDGSADSDGDGLTDLQEFAFGTNPTGGAPGPLAYEPGGSVTNPGTPIALNLAVGEGIDFRAIFGRRKNYQTAGLTYLVEFSAGLDVWVPRDTAPTVVTGENSTGDIDAVSVPYPFFIPVEGGFKKPTFFRVGVSSN